MHEQSWPSGAATGIGSMPGTDAAEAAAVVFGELPQFPYLPELPARGVGADLIGRTAALLVDIAVDVAPTGYRVTQRPGHRHRRAVDLLRWDFDALQDAQQRAGARPAVLKTQLAGPWTLAAGIELARGHRVLTDRGAVRDFADSLLEGLAAHVHELATRTGAQVVVQFDEPTLPEVLAGSLSTVSGYGTVDSVPAPEARELLSTVISGAGRITGQRVVVHCCAPRPPVALLRSAGAGALALDATLLDGAPARLLDELGEAWDAGTVFLLGLVPSESPEPRSRPDLHQVAEPALRLVDRLGFARSILAERAVPTPTCGLAGAEQDWMRRALALARDLGKAFVEPPEGW
ncbi:methionine synthase [Amycolatopsis cihanbeyliensis]|uniref:Cobalamin-independent methionine synthase catalytic subunit n=1 Tax=Amycolatopsis cihanbeyliensis TaxID=1128664 RepID=A0A542CUX4_AMYCI|nr:methionine synthase [Amycolatopsis cihanbeyliensis]TQI94622.1 cobalamin-independent methionine synthase catalytic subunit [Amycolatopsis cihanbeyliensis]